MKHPLATAAFAATLTACRPFAVCTPSEPRCTGTLVAVSDADAQ